MYPLKCLLGAHIWTFLRDIQPSKTKKSRKINCDKNRVYGTQKKHIELRNSTKKTKIELVNPVSRNKPKTIKICQFGLPSFDLFLLISHHWVVRFHFSFLRSNHELNMLLLSTINPIFDTLHHGLQK